ncbi:hypothetical protein CF319_g4562 [Tilletia indica]|nr:hypothetical protein CF319_g4562 [Tilletia indica]
MRPSSRSTASITFLLLALVLIAHLPSTAFAQKDNTKVLTSSTSNSTATSTTTRSTPDAAHTSGPPHQKGPIDDDKAAAASTTATATQTATIIAPLAPLNIPSFSQCETVIINATGSANPDFNAHDLDIQVSLPNGTEYFAETVKGSGKNPSKTPFVWTWAAVDLEAGSQFILSVNQSSSNKHSSKKDDKVPKELVLLPPTTYTVGPSPTNQTACLSETAETNHKGKKHRAAQRGQNEVKIIGAVIGSFFALLLLLIGFMALRRRSEARKSAGSGMLEYDDFDDYEGQAKRSASAVSLRNVGSDELAAGGVGAGVTGSSREANAPPASRRKSRAGYKYMSRMVGGPLESVPASEDLNHTGGTSSASNLYLPHDYGYGVGGPAGTRRRDSDESAEMGDPFANNRYTAQYTAMQQQLQHESGSGTALPNSSSISDARRERRGSHQAQELSAHLLEEDDCDDEAGSRSRGQGSSTTQQAREPLPTYRESAAGRKKRSMAAGARKSRLGADGRIQEGVVVSVRPPMYQDEWRASLGSGAEGSQGSGSRGSGQGSMSGQGRQGAGTPDH